MNKKITKAISINNGDKNKLHICALFFMSASFLVLTSILWKTKLLSIIKFNTSIHDHGKFHVPLFSLFVLFPPVLVRPIQALVAFMKGLSQLLKPSRILDLANTTWQNEFKTLCPHFCLLGNFHNPVSNSNQGQDRSQSDYIVLILLAETGLRYMLSQFG